MARGNDFSNIELTCTSTAVVASPQSKDEIQRERHQRSWPEWSSVAGMYISNIFGSSAS